VQGKNACPVDDAHGCVEGRAARTLAALCEALMKSPGDKFLAIASGAMQSRVIGDALDRRGAFRASR
jgi:hypothetical protein